MPTTRRGRVAACTYLLTVFSAVVTWMVAALLSAPDNILEASFNVVLILTFPIGLLGYGVLGVFALALGSAGVVGTIIGVALGFVVFLGAAVINVITVRGFWRWCLDRRSHRQGAR